MLFRMGIVILGPEKNRLNCSDVTLVLQDFRVIARDVYTINLAQNVVESVLIKLVAHWHYACTCRLEILDMWHHNKGALQGVTFLWVHSIYIGILGLRGIWLSQDAIDRHISSYSTGMRCLQFYVSMMTGIVLGQFTSVDNMRATYKKLTIVCN